MRSVGEVREAIYDYFQASARSKTPFCGFRDEDAYAAYYTAMYLIQDAGEAMWEHRSSGFSTKPLTAYLEYWGLMQSVIVQQDSICELYWAITGNRIKPEQVGGAWTEIRALRNLTAGHPVNSNYGELRAFMGRAFGGYSRLIYEQYSVAQKKITHPSVDLAQLLDRNESRSAAFLRCALREMRKIW